MELRGGIMNYAVVDRRTKMYFKKQRFACYKLMPEKESQTQRNTAIVGLESRQYLEPIIATLIWESS